MKKENAAKQFDKCLDISDRWDLFFTERVSMILAKFFVKLDWHPNVVTLLGGLFGIIGGGLFAFDNWITTVIGIVLCIIYAILDCADGQVARMSKKGSLFGRCLDGFIDGVVYFAIYFGVALHLCLYCNIPFTDTKWFLYIWPIMVIFGIFIHAPQCRIADYYRNVHMYLSANKRGHELTSSKSVANLVNESKKNSFKRFTYKTYYTYTRAQEKSTKNLQVLLSMIEKNNGVIPEEISTYYRQESNKIARLCNALVFNLRSYVLFALLIVGSIFASTWGNGLAFWIIPFNILVLEPIKIFLQVKYERIAKDCVQLMKEIENERK